MDDYRRRSIIYRVGAYLLVSSILITTTGASHLLGFPTEDTSRWRRAASGGNLMVGHREPCNNEGEGFPTSKELNCFQCICRNGFVECEKEQQCPSVDECFYLEKKSDGCCRRCKECTFNGTSYLSGTEWTDPDDPCVSFKCLAGVVTQVNLQCYASCSAPSPPSPDSNQCCPTCIGCKYNGQVLLEGREVTSSEDPCLKCQCKNRRLECIKKACPVLQCPLSKQKRVPGECCPKCTEQREEAFSIPGKCIMGKLLHSNGARFTTHDCATCVCNNGTLHCKRNTCPVLECPMELQIDPEPGGCCKKCPEMNELQSVCVFNQTTYQHDETWHMNSCRSCRCVNGRPNCAEIKCPAIRCRANEIKKILPGQCCPKCVESAGICTVFGDPHYKTFDGKFFSFQGMCKYQLTADCHGHSFSIRVTNDGRKTKSSSWTKTVTLKVGNLKVNLGQKLRVKVNGTRVDLPFILYAAPEIARNEIYSAANPLTSLVSGQQSPHVNVAPEVEIRMTEEGVSVVTRIGIQLLWDGTNFLQVQAPVTYKNKLCGLCGNYNGMSRDDFKTRRELNTTDVSVWQFANSWRVGGTKQCSDKHNVNYGRRATCKYRKKAILCMPLHGNQGIFESCTERVNPSNYFDSCSKDMCECESDLCYCDSFTAYAHECQRLGVALPDWRRETGCTLQAMRNGAAVLPKQSKADLWLDAVDRRKIGHRGASSAGSSGRSVIRKKPVELQLLEEKIPAELIAVENHRRRGGNSVARQKEKLARQRERRMRTRPGDTSSSSSSRRGLGNSGRRIPLPLKDD